MPDRTEFDGPKWAGTFGCGTKNNPVKSWYMTTQALYTKSQINKILPNTTR